jgi:hypothetical protein
MVFNIFFGEFLHSGKIILLIIINWIILFYFWFQIPSSYPKISSISDEFFFFNLKKCGDFSWLGEHGQFLLLFVWRKLSIVL